MLGFFTRKQTLADSGLLDGFTDHHSHLLPGVDDGFQTAEKSIEALALMKNLGVKKIWLTPHVMDDVPNSPNDLCMRFEAFSTQANDTPELRLAAENMMDSLFISRLDANDILTLDGNHPLVETSYFQPPHGMYSLIGDMINQGLRPILAHPERYRYMKEDDYKLLRNKQVAFQLNLGSIAGCYSEETKKKAEWLLNEGFYSLIGSDIHNIKFYRKTISTPLPQKVIDRLRAIPNNLEAL